MKNNLLTFISEMASDILLDNKHLLTIGIWIENNFQNVWNMVAQLTLVYGDVKIKTLGDVNGDGKVDMMDIALIARNFGRNMKLTSDYATLHFFELW